MTKRILAAFLAVMMVVGLLPTSVFAANNAECKVAETFDDHSKLHCELAGVEYTKVPNSTVAPECGQDGYTLYQCACGAYFADDIVDMDDHIPTTTEPKVARVEPTCAKNGTAAIFECETCGKDFFDPADPDADENGVIKATGVHTWETDYSGNDCTATEQFCDVCGAKNDKHVPQAEHVWNYNDPTAIVLAPTAHDEGKAVFYCSNANCTQPHEVTVAALDHEAFLKHVPAAAANCTTKGNVEHWICETCGKYYVEEAGLKVEVKAEDVIVEEQHEWLPNAIKTEPTCTTYGFIYYLCDACGETRGEDGGEDITVLPKLGHTAYPCEEHAPKGVTVAACAACRAAAGTYGAAYVEPNCTVAGEKSWYCGRCDELRTEEVKATGHAVKTIVVPGTHKYKFTYTIDYCTNENCTATPVETYYSSTAKMDLDVTVELRNGKVYDMPAGSTIALLNVRTVKAVSSGLTHFYVEDTAVQPATCTEPGKAFWYCDGTATGCNVHSDEVLPALGHIFEDETNDIEATCDTNAFKVCDRNCGEEEWLVEQENTKGHVLGEFVYTTLPTCTGDKGYNWHVCERCSVVVEDPASETVFVANKTYRGTEELTAKEEFEAEHPGFDPANYIPYRDGDCVNEGYWKAPCGDCGKTYLVLVDNTGKGHIAPAGTTYNEATCTTALGYVQYVCVFCGETIKNTNKPLGHKMTEHKKVAATCTEDGHETYWTCSNEWCQVPVILNGVELDETTPILYKDKNGAATYAAGEEVIAKLGHDKLVVATVAETCTTPGFEVELCANGCGYEMVINYVAPIEHEKGSKVTVAPDCETAGEEYYVCENGCGEKLEYKTLAALGHMNKDEKIFYDICTDTTKDRVCVRDNCNKVELDAKGNRKPIAQSHTEVTVTVDACCEHYGYTMKTCANECETYVDVVENILAPLGHLAPWGYVSNDATIAINADLVAAYGDEFLFAQENELTYTGAIKAYTPATYESLGSVTFVCCALECCQEGGAEVTRDVIKTGLDFTVEIDNASVAGADKFIDSNVIAVDVFMNAYKTDVWGFDVDVAYNADSMNYLGAVFHAGETFGKQMINDNTNYGVVSMAAYTEAEIGGVIADAEITGTVKVATLYFQLETYYEYVDVNGDIDYDFDTFGYIQVIDANISYAEGEETCGVDGEWFNITWMLDSNANDSITIKDLQICYEILKGQAKDAEGNVVDYLAAADANKDGEIDLLDLDLMNQYLVGKATEQDVYAANKWAAPEGFIAG